MKKLILFFLLLEAFCLETHAQAGLYLRTQMWGSQLDVSWLFFQQGRRVVRNPLYGVNPLQLTREQADNKSNVGSYTLSGRNMTIRWENGKTQTVTVDVKNGELTGFDGGICSKAQPFASRFIADKTYSGTAVYGSVGRSQTFFFGKDGQFMVQRLGSVSGAGNTSGAAASTSEERGTYVIAGNTIIFKYASGKEWRVIAQPYDLGNEELLINDQLMRKK